MAMCRDGARPVLVIIARRDGARPVFANNRGKNKYLDI